jgi:ABC-2 type transport system ATP-binding protein
VIEVDGLTKVYGRHVAADHLTFSVKQGEVLGFLGPNGAGKTTTMNMITGYLSPTSGTSTVGGHDVLEEPMEVKRLIGYMPENPPLYPEMTVLQYLTFVCRIKGVPRAHRLGDLDRIMEIVGITDMRTRLVRNLSKGYKQRVGLAQSLVGNPPVLILDEPTIGLDPRQIIEIRNLIRQLGREHTIILSSHILPEVTMVCQRVIIIHRGAIVASDTIESLSRRLGGGQRLSVRLDGAERNAAAVVKAVPQVRTAESQGSREAGTFDLYVEAEGDRDIRRPVSLALSRAGFTIMQMKPVDLTLEDIFIQLTTEEAS